MTKAKTFLISIIILCFGTTFSFAQGCSDAGFCTMNSFKPNNGEDSLQNFKNQLKVSAFYGLADNSISVFGNYVEFNRQLNNRLGFDVKMTTLAQNGNNISTFGLSDIFTNVNYKATEKIKFSLGAKIPLSNSSRSENNLPLPMDYQSSLGTFDLIFGIGYQVKKLQFVAAIQQPLTQNNNQFVASKYSLTSPFNKFQSTNKFIRSGDVLLRMSYPFTIKRKLILTPSILPIYHLGTDKYTNELNIEKEIIGSDGLTLNGNVYADYEINQKNTIQFNVGMPFVVRTARPDGLTRSLIATLEYRFKF